MVFGADAFGVVFLVGYLPFMLWLYNEDGDFFYSDKDKHDK